MNDQEIITAGLDKIALPNELKTLYIYVKGLLSGTRFPDDPPAPFDHIDIPDGVLGDFMEAVDDLIKTRQSWTRLDESTQDVVLWRLPNGKVFRETLGEQGNVLKFEYVEDQLQS